MLFQESVVNRFQPGKFGAMFGTFFLGILFIADISGATEKKQSELLAEKFDKVMIYRLPYARKISATNIKLFPHYMPLRSGQGWTYALIDLGYKMTNPVMIEKIPGRANYLIGRKPFGERAYIALAGKGYTEIRKDPQIPGKKIYWEKGDAFTAPYGYWVGHANPYEHPARILSMGVALTNDLINPDIEMASDRPKLPYVLNILPFEQDDLIAEKIEPQSSPPPEPVKPSKEIKHHTVYQTTWGTKVNLDKLKTLKHHFLKRAKAGWKSAHLELGGRILNHFVIQDMPPNTIEVGHKHGKEVVFLALKGKGTIAFREETDSPENKISWEAGDLFCLPWKREGIWHAHSNPYQEPARFMASVNKLEGRFLLNPYFGQIHRIFPASGSADRDHVFGKKSWWSWLPWPF